MLVLVSDYKRLLGNVNRLMAHSILQTPAAVMDLQSSPSTLWEVQEYGT